MTCEKCGSTHVVEGRITSARYDVFFIKLNTSIFSRKSSGITATASSECGHIFNLKLDKPQRLQ